MLDADADASAAAASAAAAAGTLANTVKKTGEASQSIAGDIAVAGNLSGGVVTGTQVTVPAPVNNTDAANKKYVDDADALKANKTYVDAQDALAVPIANINQYALGLTGNQIFAGVKSSRAYYETITAYPQNPPDNVNRASNFLRIVSSDNVEIARLLVFQYSDQTTGVQLAVRNSDGTTKTVLLGKGDVI